MNYILLPSRILTKLWIQLQLIAWKRIKIEFVVPCTVGVHHDTTVIIELASLSCPVGFKPSAAELDT